jgi:hypothetical protein
MRLLTEAHKPYLPSVPSTWSHVECVTAKKTKAVIKQQDW